jgi:hypothetical protein
MIQRRFSIGYNRAGRLMDQLQHAGIVGPAQGAKPRDVLVMPTRTASLSGYSRFTTDNSWALDNSALWVLCLLSSDKRHKSLILNLKIYMA